MSEYRRSNFEKVLDYELSKKYPDAPDEENIFNAHALELAAKDSEIERLKAEIEEYERCLSDADAAYRDLSNEMKKKQMW